METAMKLRAYIKLEDDGTLTARSELHDGTPFSLKVGVYDVQLNEEFTNSMREVTGSVFVTQLSLQDTRAYIQLPCATIQHGKNVTVHKFKLQPHGVTIDNFKSSPLGLKEPPLEARGLIPSPVPKEVSGKRFVDVTPSPTAEEVAKDVARQLAEQEDA